jgi:small conductance mechanosensitive channel
MLLQIVLDDETMSRTGQLALNMIMERGPSLVLAILTLFIGIRLINWSMRLFRKKLLQSAIDKNLTPMISNIINWGLKIMLFISVASMLGIETTSFIALLGAGGLAIGLALQGALQNFAGGVMLVVFKPFKTGDFVEAGGFSGYVEDIHIIYTKLKTLTNELVIVPNSILSNGSVKNYTANGFVRVDMTIGISYSSDIQAAFAVLLKLLMENELILKDPSPFVGVINYGESSIDLAVRPYTKIETYWDVWFGVHKEMKKRLDEIGINIPFPQRDVHLFEHKLPGA